ncbi:MAG: serine hydrolase domain-containing protein [Planctomycetota bacterium]
MTLSLFASTALLLAAQSSAAPELVSAAGQPLSIERLERLLEEERERLHVAGGAAAVLNDSRVVWTGVFGDADHRGGAAVDADTIFEAASITKPLFGYLAMRFVERGELDLDAPLHELFPHPDLGSDRRAQAVTPRMVLAHTTGLPNWRQGALRFEFDPGTAFGYSGEAYVWLGRALEQRSGLPLDELFEREVFAPLGMASSDTVWSESIAARKAAAHLNGDVAQVEVWRPERAVPASSLHTTAVDLARFLEHVLAREGLSDAAYDELFARHSTPAAEDPKQNQDGSISWGLGWVREPGPHGLRLHHGGTNRGFEGHVELQPETGSGFVVLTNSDRGSQLIESVRNYLADGRLPAPPAPRPGALALALDDPRWKVEGAVEREGAGTATALRLVEDFTRLELGGEPFDNFLLEVDVAVDQAFGFAGVTFRGDEQGHEEVYLRAHESGTPDALQYSPTFHGVAGWQLYPGFNHHRTAHLRQREWMRLRLAVFEDWMEVFLDDPGQLALHVYDLKHGEREGAIGLWGTAGTRFRNLVVTPLESWDFTYDYQPLPPLPPGFVPRWEVSSPFDGSRLEGLYLPAELGDELTWSPLATEHTGVVNVARLAGLERGDTVLARFVIDAEERQRMRLDFGYSDDARVYLDGELLFHGRSGLDERGEPFHGRIGLHDALYLALEEGENEVVFALTESMGGWGAMAKLADASGVEVLSD